MDIYKQLFVFALPCVSLAILVFKQCSVLCEKQYRIILKRLNLPRARKFCDIYNFFRISRKIF